MKNFFKDPLLHFLLIGIFVFVFFEYKNSSEKLASEKTHNQSLLSTPNENQIITLTEDKVIAVIDNFKKRYNRAPTNDELLTQLQPLIKTEVFYRQGLALGLDKDDDQVKQRIAEKMQFLTEDIVKPSSPTTAQLQHYLDEHQFSVPAKVDFEHLFFSYSRKNTNSELTNIANQALNKLRKGQAVKQIATATTLSSNTYKNATMSMVIKAFGYSDFSSKVFTLPSDSTWQGPFKSKFGLHLVKISKLTTTNKSPSLENVISEVNKAWLQRERKQNNLNEYEKLKKTYEIKIHFPSAVDINIDN